MTKLTVGQKFLSDKTGNTMEITAISRSGRMMVSSSDGSEWSSQHDKFLEYVNNGKYTEIKKMKTIQEWKDEQIEDTVKYFEWAKEEQDKMFASENHYTYVWSTIPKWVKVVLSWGSACWKDEATKAVENHFKKLEAKAITKGTGKLIGLESFGNLYKLIGESGTAVIEIIEAGGYNIQRRHQRWLFK